MGTGERETSEKGEADCSAGSETGRLLPSRPSSHFNCNFTGPNGIQGDGLTREVEFVGDLKVF